MATKEVSARAKKIHQEAIVIDMLEPWFTAMDDWSEEEIGYLQTLVKAGVTAVNATIPYTPDDVANSVKRIAKLYKAIENSKFAKVAFTAADIEAAKKEGKTAVIIGAQDSVVIEKDLDFARAFKRLGLNVIQLAYYGQNYIGSGCAESVDRGISDKGKEAIKALNKLGILIDVSHCGDQTALEAAQFSAAPIALTHISPKVLCNFNRAKLDKTIKTVAEKGGVIGQCILSSFIYKEGERDKRQTLSDYVDLIDYMVKMVGVDHVGIGTDVTPFWTKDVWDFYNSHYIGMLMPRGYFPYEIRYPEGFDGMEDTINITEELLRHGYSDDETRKLLGGNWLRLVKEVWK
jgi:membrane dipeptidase